MIKRGARTQDTATAFAGYGTGNRTPALVRYKNESINRLVTFTIRQQLPALPGFVDPYIEWPHFPARVYSTSLSPQLEGVDPEWIV